MDDQSDQLRRRVRRLERVSLVQWGVIAVALLSTAAIAFLPKQPASTGVLRGHRLELSRPDGKNAILASVDEEGRAVLRLEAGPGKHTTGTVLLAVGPTGEPTLRLGVESPGVDGAAVEANVSDEGNTTLRVVSGGEYAESFFQVRGPPKSGWITLRYGAQFPTVASQGFDPRASLIVGGDDALVRIEPAAVLVDQSGRDGKTWAALGRTSTRNVRTGAETTTTPGTLTLFNRDGVVTHQVP